jgi:hypothetical protein
MAKQPVADYREALEILTKLARGGDVRAAIALAGHLRQAQSRDPVQRRRDELAARRKRRARA